MHRKCFTALFGLFFQLSQSREAQRPGWSLIETDELYQRNIWHSCKMQYDSRQGQGTKAIICPLNRHDNIVFSILAFLHLCHMLGGKISWQLVLSFGAGRVKDQLKFASVTEKC